MMDRSARTTNTGDIAPGNRDAASADSKDAEGIRQQHQARVQDLPLYVEGTLGFSNYDPKFVAIRGDERREIPTKWSSFTATGGIGWEKFLGIVGNDFRIGWVQTCPALEEILDKRRVKCFLVDRFRIGVERARGVGAILWPRIRAGGECRERHRQRVVRKSIEGLGHLRGHRSEPQDIKVDEFRGGLQLKVLLCDVASADNHQF